MVPLASARRPTPPCFSFSIIPTTYFNLVIDFISFSLRPDTLGKNSMTKIVCMQMYTVVPITYVTYSFLYGIMCIEFHRLKKRLAAQFWELELEIGRVSSPVARCWGCGCTTLSGTIIRSLFQENPCGIPHDVSCVYFIHSSLTERSAPHIWICEHIFVHTSLSSHTHTHTSLSTVSSVW